MHILEAMAAGEEQVSSITVPECGFGNSFRFGEHCLYTPPVKSGPNETQGWMAPMKPVRRDVVKVVRTENGEMRVTRDSVLISKNALMADEYADFTDSPLRPFPTIEVMADEADEEYTLGQLGKAMRLDEGKQFLEHSLRFYPNFDSKLEDDCINTCKRRVDIACLHPFLFPALVRH